MTVKVPIGELTLSSDLFIKASKAMENTPLTFSDLLVQCLQNQMQQGSVSQVLSAVSTAYERNFLTLVQATFYQVPDGNAYLNLVLSIAPTYLHEKIKAICEIGL